MIVEAKVVKGIPLCPQCETNQAVEDYGWDNGFWFSFNCPTCSGKRQKVTVRYSTDENFKLKEGRN